MANITWLEEDGYDEELDDQGIKGEFVYNADGYKLYLKTDGPYGFIKVFTNKGAVPKELASQQWTDVTMARAAVANYVEKQHSKVKLKPKGEPAKIKSEAATKRKMTEVANKAKEQDG